MTPERPTQSVDGDQHKTCGVCGQDYEAFDFTQHSHHSTTLHAPISDPEAPSS